MENLPLLLYDNPGRDWLEDNIADVWSEAVLVAGGICGVVVLSEADGSFYEAASFGYADEGFYYSFMARGQGNFEKLKDQPRLTVSGDELELWAGSVAEIFRISSGGALLGFLLVEFEVPPGDLQSGFLALLAEKSGLVLSVIPSREDSFSWLVEQLPDISRRLEKIRPGLPVLLAGPRGSGKKALSKYLFHKWGLRGGMIVVNTYPDQESKLEKSLREWAGMSRGGMIVFDRIEQLGVAQQKTVFEYVEGQDLFLAVFIDSVKKTEIYPPLWEVLKERQVSMPSIDSLDKQLLEDFIRHLFLELSVQKQRNGLQLSGEALDKLKFMNYEGNLREMKNILETAILNSTSQVVAASEIKTTESSVGTPESEDLDLRSCVESLERQKIMLASRLFSGNQLRMAKALGISRGSLQYKMRQMGLL